MVVMRRAAIMVVLSMRPEPLEGKSKIHPKMAVSIFRCSTSHRNVNDRHSTGVKKKCVKNLLRTL